MHSPPEPAKDAAAAGGRQGAAVAFGLVGVLMFAGTLPATRIAVTAFDPFFVTVARAALAGLVAGAVLMAARVPVPSRQNLGVFAAIAVCLVFGFPFFTALGMERVPAAHGGVVLAILPLATAVAATALAGERPGVAFWALSIVGGALVLAFSVSSAGWSLALGDLALLAAAASAATGYALSGRMTRTMPGWAVIAWALVLALPVTLALTLAGWPPALPVRADVWAAFLYVALVSMLGGFVFWNVALALGGVAKIGQLQLVQPFATMAIAALANDEPLSLRLALFAAAIVPVVGAAQRSRVRRAG